MTLQDFRNIRDNQRGINRDVVYGSSRAYFPYPHKLLSSESMLTKFGTPGKLVRNNKDSSSTTNYEHIQNLKELSKLLSATNQVQEIR